jgi:hypothetical protein
LQNGLWLAIHWHSHYGFLVSQKSKGCGDSAARIYRKLMGARGMDEAERWQHALFFAMSPQERCQFSLKTARSVLSSRRSAKRKEADLAVLPILRRTLRLARRLTKRPKGTAKLKPRGQKRGH